MESYLRYFVELELPMAAVDTALDALSAEWLASVANKAHDRSLRFMLEVDPLGHNLAGAVVVFGMQPAVRHGSTSIRTMAWALVGRAQLAVAGRYYLPGAVRNRRIDRGTAQRVGEATIKDFVDGLTNLVQGLVPGPTRNAAAVA
jgi:hypothetical protein